MAEIHNYQNEAQIFGDDDFYDIDFYNGTGYETKKILGSTIKAGIIASVPAPNVKTIYSDDDNVSGDRTIKGVAGTHFFKMVDFSTFEFSAQNVESECFKINVPTGDSFTSFVIANSANNNPMLSVENGYITITGTRDSENREESDDGRFFRAERSYGKFHRNIPLPGEIKEESISAEYKKGVLTIKMPKVNQEMTKQDDSKAIPIM